MPQDDYSEGMEKAAGVRPAIEQLQERGRQMARATAAEQGAEPAPVRIPPTRTYIHAGNPIPHTGGKK